MGNGFTDIELRLRDACGEHTPPQQARAPGSAFFLTFVLCGPYIVDLWSLLLFSGFARVWSLNLFLQWAQTDRAGILFAFQYGCWNPS